MTCSKKTRAYHSHEFRFIIFACVGQFPNCGYALIILAPGRQKHLKRSPDGAGRLLLMISRRTLAASAAMETTLRKTASALLRAAHA